MRFLLTVVVMALALSGCALTTEQIELHYNPQQQVAPVTGANNVSVNVQVTDQRPDKSKVSSKKNGYGMETAPITAAEDVTVTIRKAIEQELHTRGFQLASTDALVLITADVIQFYNDHKMGFFSGDSMADLNMSVTVKSRGGKMLYTKQIVAQGIEKHIQITSGNNARLALDKALENGMKILFEDREFLAALVVSPSRK